MSRLKAGALFLSGTLAALFFCGWLIIDHANDNAEAIVQAKQDGYEAAEREHADFLRSRTRPSKRVRWVACLRWYERNARR